jgi:basic amino acid/polyamine antiporter, APA family
MLAFTSAHFSLIMLRIKKPDMDRPFRIPLNIKIKGYYFPISAILGGICTLSVWFLVIFTKPDGRYLGIAWMVIGTALYLYYRKKTKLKAAGTLSVEKVPAPAFKSLKIGKIVVPLSDAKTFNSLLKIALDTAINHTSKITAIHYIDVPYTVPLDTHLMHSEHQALKSWQALAESKGVELKFEIARSRKIDDVIFDIVKDEKADLVIMSEASKRLLKKLKSKSKVWICN